MTSLQSRLDESSSDQEFLVVNRSPEKKLQRIVQGFRRMTLRVLFLVQSRIAAKVTAHWNQQAAVADGTERLTTKVARAKTKRKPRRDDLIGIGKPMAPTAKEYPMQRSQCQHSDSQGNSLLKAAGGRTTGNQSLYLWVCQQCGSRWHRTPESSPLLESPCSATATQNPQDVAAAAAEKQRKPRSLQPAALSSSSSQATRNRLTLQEDALTPIATDDLMMIDVYSSQEEDATRAMCRLQR